VWTL